MRWHRWAIFAIYRSLRGISSFASQFRTIGWPAVISKGGKYEMEMNRYNVKLFEVFENDLGEMAESHLYGYLKNRPLIGCTAEEVLARLQKETEVRVCFASVLARTEINALLLVFSERGED